MAAANPRPDPAKVTAARDELAERRQLRLLRDAAHRAGLDASDVSDQPWRSRRYRLDGDDDIDDPTPA